MEIAFMMDHLQSINPNYETTSYLMYECNQRGHTVYFLEPHDIYIRNDQVVARMRNVTVPPDQTMTCYWQCMIECLKRDELIFESVTDLDALFFAKKPAVELPGNGVPVASAGSRVHHQSDYRADAGQQQALYPQLSRYHHGNARLKRPSPIEKKH